MTLRKLRVNLLRLAFVPMVFVAIFVRPNLSLESSIAFIMEASGFLFLLAGLLIRIWCTFYIGGKKSKELITIGPYSLCRNPLYIGTLILVIGIGLSFENLIILTLIPAIILPVHLIVVWMEEVHLERVFGEDYRMYKQKVPKFWPNFSNYNSPDPLTVNVHAIWRITRDTIGILLLPWIEDLLEVLHHHDIVPVLWHFP